MIKLFQFPSFWNLPNVSPFCLKVETYLRMAKLPFEVVAVGDPRPAPKGKLPYIEDDGSVVADSGMIVTYLKEKYQDKLDSSLTPLQKAESLALQRLMEEHLYWVMVYARWIDPANWPMTKKAFLAKVPLLMRELVAAAVKKKIIKYLYCQGIGRHKPEEIYELGLDDLRALNEMLNNHAFLVRDVPTSIDACGYAFIANILEVPIQSPLKDYVKSQPNFVHYCEQMKEKFY
jgi:glutathione S-transferase